MATLAAFLLLASPAARAGSYSATYSGGTYNGLGGQYGAPGTYPDGGGSSSGYGGSGSEGGGGASCQGAISTTFTWQPAYSGEPAPSSSSVIITETSTATSQTRASGSDTAKCDDGLGASGSVQSVPGAAQYSSGPNPQVTGYFAQASASDVRYTAWSGSSLSVTPTASVSGTGAQSSGASVSYAASATPVTITLGGTLTDSNNKPVLDSGGNQQVLTGQQITATLSSFPKGFTVTKYTWSAGGSTFKTYDPSQSSNQLAPLGPGELTGPASGSSAVTPLAFYDGKQESLTVTCTISVNAPDGTPLSLTATAPTLDVAVPTVARWDIYTGYVQYVQDPTTSQRGYQLMPASGSTHAGGEAWTNTTIALPVPFVAVGGSGCFAQLITPDTEITNDDPAKSPTFLNNKQKGLDNSFPYKGYQWNVSGTGANFDGPGLFYENYNSSGYDGYSKVSESDNFTTWVMYQPPGGVWVPLQSYDWTWSFTSVWNSSLNQWKLFRANPPYATSDPGYTGANNSTPPQWSLVQNNTPTH